MELTDKVAIVTGSGRGIGKGIAKILAKDGAKIIVADMNLDDALKVASEIDDLGSSGTPLRVDVTVQEAVDSMVDSVISKFGQIDILVNNASAINLTGTLQTSMKRYDLMHHINTRGTFLTSKLCIPHLKKGDNPHILNLSPPLNMEARWFGPHVAYTMAKFGMGMCVLGMAEEFKGDGIGVNGLWPRTAIATAAIQMVGGDQLMQASRKPEICRNRVETMGTHRENHGNHLNKP